MKGLHMFYSQHSTNRNLIHIRIRQFWIISSSNDVLCQLEPYWHETCGPLVDEVTCNLPFVIFYGHILDVFRMLFIEYFIYLDKKRFGLQIWIWKMRCSILIFYSILGVSHTKKVSYLCWYFIMIFKII